MAKKERKKSYLFAQCLEIEQFQMKSFLKEQAMAHLKFDGVRRLCCPVCCGRQRRNGHQEARVLNPACLNEQLNQTTAFSLEATVSLLQNEGIEPCPQPWRSGLLKRASQVPEKARQDPKAVKTIKLKGTKERKSWREGGHWAVCGHLPLQYSC